MTTLDIRLKKTARVFQEGEVLAGLIVVESKGECTHQGITLTAEGAVNLQLSAKSVGMFEAFYNSVKPIQLISQVLDIAKPGKLPSGITEIPFEIPLKAKGNKTLYETYHGVFISIQADMKRNLLNKDLHREMEFLVEYKDGEKCTAEPLDFIITPETLANNQTKAVVPKFKITGKLETKFCNITNPFTGELTVESCSMPLKSIELQLVRVETCGCAEGYAKDATEIQNIQIADGDVARMLPIPIYMIFPRLFTAPTLATNNFKIDFEVNVVIVFIDQTQVTENIPIRLTRF